MPTAAVRSQCQAPIMLSISDTAVLANLLRWLEVSSPDVACLQEIKCTNAAFPRKALEAAGYSAIWCGQGPHHAVAILARDVDPIETRRNLPVRRPWSALH
jgi:exodeoxyribonuclease-3